MVLNNLDFYLFVSIYLSAVFGPHHIAMPTPELPSTDPSALTEEPDKVNPIFFFL